MGLLVKSKPFGLFPNLWDDESVREFFNADQAAKTVPTKAPLANVKETDLAYEIEVALPGFGKDQISLDIEDNVLTIKAHKEQSSEEKGRYTRKEFISSSYSRSFQLPEKLIDNDKVGAKLEHGILYIDLPKKKEVIEEKMPKRIKVS